jgi:hypothetical protein
MLQRRYRILDVLQHVVRDHEVQRPVGKSPQALAVVGYISLYHPLGPAEDRWGMRREQALAAHHIHVTHSRRMCKTQRTMQRPDLDAVSSYVTPRKVFTEGVLVPAITSVE